MTFQLYNQGFQLQEASRSLYLVWIQVQGGWSVCHSKAQRIRAQNLKRNHDISQMLQKLELIMCQCSLHCSFCKAKGSKNHLCTFQCLMRAPMVCMAFVKKVRTCRQECLQRMGHPAHYCVRLMRHQTHGCTRRQTYFSWVGWPFLHLKTIFMSENLRLFGHMLKKFKSELMHCQKNLTGIRRTWHNSS